MATTQITAEEWIRKTLRQDIHWTAQGLAGGENPKNEDIDIWTVTATWNGRCYDIRIALPLTLATAIEEHTDWVIRAA